MRSSLSSAFEHISFPLFKLNNLCRSKMFYKEGAEFSERGIGMLHVKKTDVKGKVQLLMRAQNATGACLCGGIHSKEMP